MDPATISAIMSAIGPILQSFMGNKEKMGSTYSKGQRSTIDDLLQQVKGMKGGMDITNQPGFQQGQDWLSSLFNDENFFNNIEAPAMRQFNEEIIPGVASRFASQGSGGSLGSTGFRNQIAREGSNLATNLAAQRGQMQQQGVNQQLGYSQQPFQNIMQLLQQALTPTNNTFQPSSTGF